MTGATGFVGSHLVERLCREGVEVACLVRPTSRLAWLEGLEVETRTAPLEEADALAEAVAGADVVFHAAGLTRARAAKDYMAVNAAGTRRLLAAVERSAPGLRRFVYVSSLAAAGPTPWAEPLDESAEPRPHDAYGASKLAAEQAVLGAGLPGCVVRPPAVYGPRDRNLLPLFRMAQRLGLAPVIGSRAKEVSLVHAADLASCLWLAATSEAAAGETYFVGSGTHRWTDVIAALAAALGRRVRGLRVPAFAARLAGELGELRWTLTGTPQILCRRKVRDLLQPRWTCSWAKAERELGYRAAVPLAEGMAHTAAWYAEQGWLRPLGRG
ncbi:MAG: NAD-dependent epimerase/dehydratase family protein [Candidatus Brocadiia bacterium]